MESTWVVNWDNSEVGWVSATGTRGTATARFRASGDAGQHQVRIYSGYMGQSYLNHEQAPNAYLPRPAFTFRITPGHAPAAAYAEPYAKQPVPQPDKTTAAAIVTPRYIGSARWSAARPAVMTSACASGRKRDGASSAAGRSLRARRASTPHLDGPRAAAHESKAPSFCGLEAWNKSPTPFAWTNPADAIIKSHPRMLKRISTAVC